MDVKRSNERLRTWIVPVNFTILAGYVAFGMAPAAGGFKQVLIGAVMAIWIWAWFAFSWWRTRAADISTPPSDDS
jgi:hypothetical protein